MGGPVGGRGEAVVRNSSRATTVMNPTCGGCYCRDCAARRSHGAGGWRGPHKPCGLLCGRRTPAATREPPDSWPAWHPVGRQQQVGRTPGRHVTGGRWRRPWACWCTAASGACGCPPCAAHRRRRQPPAGRRGACNNRLGRPTLTRHTCCTKRHPSPKPRTGGRRG